MDSLRSPYIWRKIHSTLYFSRQKAFNLILNTIRPKQKLRVDVEKTCKINRVCWNVVISPRDNWLFVKQQAALFKWPLLTCCCCNCIEINFYFIQLNVNKLQNSFSFTLEKELEIKAMKTQATTTNDAVLRFFLSVASRIHCNSMKWQYIIVSLNSFDKLCKCIARQDMGHSRTDKWYETSTIWVLFPFSLRKFTKRFREWGSLLTCTRQRESNVIWFTGFDANENKIRETKKIGWILAIFRDISNGICKSDSNENLSFIVMDSNKIEGASVPMSDHRSV